MQEPSKVGHEMHEADIGSGEKPLSQRDTEDMIRQVPPGPLPTTQPDANDTSPRTPIPDKPPRRYGSAD